jgi:FlaG/FlaF family flagellin (archaellin)
MRTSLVVVLLAAVPVSFWAGRVTARPETVPAPAATAPAVTAVAPEAVQRMSQVLNERLAGHTLREIHML